MLDILLAAEELRSFVAGHDGSVLVENSLVRGAVLHALIIIGEAATRILKIDDTPPHPELPWRKMADLRNVIVGIGADRRAFGEAPDPESRAR